MAKKKKASSAAAKRAAPRAAKPRNWGGVRAGAGRKHTGVAEVTFLCAMPSQLKQRLDEASKALDVPRREIVREALEAWMSKHKR